MAESESPSAFSISDDEVTRVLQNGSGFANGKMRIQTLYASEHDPKKRADYLKDEYGLGGRSWTFSDGSRGFVDYSSKGMLIRSYEHDAERRLRWPEVEKMLDALFRDGRYLSEQEQAEYDRLQEDYAGFGGIPLPSPAHAFPAIEDLTRKQEEAELGAAQDAGQNDQMGVIEESTQEVDLSGTEAGQTQEEITTETLPGINFRITDDHLGEGGPKEKFERNIEAIETLFTLEAEKRNATPEEQEILSRYVGWGGLADVFDPNKDNWAKEYAQLKALLPEQEYEMARASTLNAHYTSPTVIRAIYDALGQIGFKSGNILEPAMGIGNFFGMLPEAMQDSRLYGVELDSITGRIAQKLYPEAEITVAGFETTDRRDFYDLAVGNVPFGNYRVSDKPYDRLGFSIHNYFFAKALDQVRPGGIVAFVTSRYTMDQQSTEVRKYLAQRAELLGVIRLPNNAFRANAGTDVVSDIIFLQKRDHPIDIEPDWVHLGQTPEGLSLNSYFVDHPEMVLGQLTTESTQYGKQECTVLPVPGVELSEQLKEAVSHIRGSYTPQAITEQDFGDVPDSIPADPNVKNFSYTVVSGEVFFRENSVMRPVDLNEKMKGRIKGLVALRQIVNELIDYQMNDYPEEDIAAKQRELNTAYDAFTAEYGIINNRANAQAFAEDSSYYLLCSLENINEDGELESKADMFTKRTIRPERKVTSVDTPSEALAISIGEKGRVDLPYMAELLGTPGEYREIITELQGVIFKDPMAEVEIDKGWQTADEYLSGEVRHKLKLAKIAAESDPFFQIKCHSAGAGPAQRPGCLGDRCAAGGNLAGHGYHPAVHAGNL